MRQVQSADLLRKVRIHPEFFCDFRNRFPFVNILHHLADILFQIPLRLSDSIISYPIFFLTRIPASEKITADSLCKILLDYDRMYSKMSDVEKKSVISTM